MIEILAGDARDLLPFIPAGVIQTCVTSPPYFGLRDYGTATWEGGDPRCDHGLQRWEGPLQTLGAQSGHAARADRLDRRECDCGARRVDRQIGLEGDMDHYVASLVAVFREVRRVLRDDGNLWLNLGDSYNAYNGNRGRSTSFQQATEAALPDLPHGYGLTCKELKQKDLIGIPWRVAFALQADGWYLRSDIIWAKGNPMPESVRDRPTRAHEYLFLFTKQPSYYYDIDAIREPAVSTETFTPLGRNKRSWWPINTRPFKGAHFATFPPDLVRPCLLAGSSPHACARCLAPYRRALEYGDPPRDWQQACGSDAEGEYHGQATKEYAAAKAQDASAVKARILAGMKTARTVDWHPSCSCGSGDPASSWVLDPFAGSGTVGLVAQELGRHALLLELNPEYVALAKRRINKEKPCLPPETAAGDRA